MATVALAQESFEQTVSVDDIVLVGFWMIWCGPYRQLNPILEEASKEYPDIASGKVDTDDQQQMVIAAQITSIPILMVSHDGIVMFHQSDVLPLSVFEDLVSQTQNLDMGEVREQIAEIEAGEFAER